MEKKVAVYIHIPFCKSICSYCDFCKVYHFKKWVNDYLHALEKEIKDRYLDEKVRTLYIGGGSPSALTNQELDKLFNIIKIFDLDDNVEFTFECNLNDLTYDLIDYLKEKGINRISIGIESFNKNNLQFLKRNSSFKDAQNKINYAKKAGINNINVDLIYALPNETMFMLKKDLKYIKKLSVNHISTYSLMIEEHTFLANQQIKPITEELDFKMYKCICKALKRWGYNHYEISNFAIPGFESKHNLTYWNNEEYYGFGLSSSGYIEGVRYNNTKNLTKYLNGEYIASKEILSEKDRMEYEVILNLRKTEGINVKEFNEKYHQNFQNVFDIEELLNNKELIYKNGNIFINPDKLYVMNEILVKFISS